jgi:hypothetical protein
VHLPDHGLLGRQIELGGDLPDHLRCPATFWRGALPGKKDIVKIGKRYQFHPVEETPDG